MPTTSPQVFSGFELRYDKSHRLSGSCPGTFLGAQQVRGQACPDRMQGLHLDHVYLLAHPYGERPQGLHRDFRAAMPVCVPCPSIAGF